MTDQLISFETAKLAKEKRCELITINLTFLPTQSLLQKWLREVHEIDVLVKRTPPYPKLYYTLIYFKTNYSNVIEHTGSGNDKTYEEALEQGLIEALKFIS